MVETTAAMMVAAVCSAALMAVVMAEVVMGSAAVAMGSAAVAMASVGAATVEMVAGEREELEVRAVAREMGGLVAQQARGANRRSTSHCRQAWR